MYDSFEIKFSVLKIYKNRITCTHIHTYIHSWASILGLNLLNLNSVDHMNEQISLSEEFNHETIRWIAFNSSHLTCNFSKKIHHKTDQLEITWHNIKPTDHWTRHWIDLLSLISFFTLRFNFKIASKRNRFLWELKEPFSMGIKIS